MGDRKAEGMIKDRFVKILSLSVVDYKSVLIKPIVLSCDLVGSFMLSKGIV